MIFTVDLQLVQKTLDKMDAAIRRRLLRSVCSLTLDPRPPGARKLEGVSNTWRVRVGDYRILYIIRDDRLLVLVISIGHRREVYR
ncbi:MAG: type II toxin-antitoxin system RelE/ParE family toxin [Magnetococcales bacterium]|nr:type II toxin-antitoxin system RelE/ParE family toxin [Magnetococcales bacterium]